MAEKTSIGWTTLDVVQRRVERIATSYNNELRADDVTIIEEKTRDAYFGVLARLASRGYTRAQADTWAQREEFQVDVATYYSLVSFGYRRGDEEDWISDLRRLEELLEQDDDGTYVLAIIDEEGNIIEPGTEPSGVFQVIDLEEINEDLEVSLP